MNDLFQEESQVFKLTSLLVLLHYVVGKDWAGSFVPPSKMFCPFYLSFGLWFYATLSLYLYRYEQWYKQCKSKSDGSFRSDHGFHCLLINASLFEYKYGTFHPPSII